MLGKKQEGGRNMGMYAKIKKEIGHEYYQQNFSNDGQRFVAWY